MEQENWGVAETHFLSASNSLSGEATYRLIWSITAQITMSRPEKKPC